jgi:dihydropteroate synthase
VIMHNKTEATDTNNIVDEVSDHLKSQAQKALAAGLLPEQIILDPGIGFFGKTPDQNLELLSSLGQIPQLGFPTLIGPSRKSTIGQITGRDAQDRDFGTAATVAFAIAAGFDIVRVHNVRAMIDVVKTSDALVRGWRPANWEK